MACAVGYRVRLRRRPGAEHRLGQRPARPATCGGPPPSTRASPVALDETDLIDSSSSLAGHEGQGLRPARLRQLGPQPAGTAAPGLTTPPCARRCWRCPDSASRPPIVVALTVTTCPLLRLRRLRAQAAAPGRYGDGGGATRRPPRLHEAAVKAAGFTAAELKDLHGLILACQHALRRRRLEWPSMGPLAHWA